MRHSGVATQIIAATRCNLASRRYTFSERRWPDTPEFATVARRWNKDAIDVLFGLIWHGYDLLLVEVLRNADWYDVKDDVERDITELLEPLIRRAMTGFEPFEFQHGRHERETRCVPPAQPPQYDLAFYLREQPRVSLPLEAKVLHTDQALAEYVSDLRQEFLTCRYAPFSTVGAMLGYLMKGKPSSVFSKLERVVPCELRQHEGFPKREHRVSNHRRTVAPGKIYPVDFQCHHLILSMIPESDGPGSAKPGQDVTDPATPPVSS